MSTCGCRQYLCVNTITKTSHGFTFNSNSDWDLLVCLNKDLENRQKRKLASLVRTKLAKDLIPIDIIIKSKQQLDNEKDSTGMLAHYALRDGIEI